MSLRVKALLSVGMGLAALVATLALTSRSAILDGFRVVEEEDVRDGLARVTDALAVDAAALESTTTDYAQWDDTYEFAATNADAFVTENLNADTWERMRIGACIVQRADGSLVRRLGYDLAAGAERAVPDALVEVLTKDRELALRVRREKGVVGLVGAGTAGLWLVAAVPIVRSDSSGPARGTLFLGRPIDRAEVARLAETTHRSLRITMIPTSERPSAGVPSLVRVLSPDRIAGFARLLDVRDRPVAVLRTISPRPVLAHGRAVWELVLAAFIAVAVFAGGATLLLLERTVLARLREIVGAAKHVVGSGDLSTRVPVRSGDELATVAYTLNGMLAELERTQGELRDKEQRWRGLVELLPDGVLVHDGGTVLLANAAARQMLGVTSDAEVIGQPVGDFVQTTPEADPGAGIHEPGAAVARLVAVDGRSTEVELRQVPFSAMGRPAIQLVAHDVTERRRLEAQLRQTQKMEALGRLAGGVAHDFNNLVMVIGAHCEVLLEELEDGEVKESVGEIRKAGLRAASLTRQLLAFSRKQVLQPEVLDLNAVLDDVDRMLRRLIGEDIDLVTERAPDLWTVKADAGQLEQVLMNLAVNAREAMPRGGRLVIETTNARSTADADDLPQGDWVKLTVKDNGTGMDQATQARVFEPFFTTKVHCTGLGLATVFGIVQQSRGRIRVRSEVGRGTTFDIFLPREVGGEAERPAPIHRPRTGHELILVVEDEPALRHVVCDVLRRVGYHVVEARDGREAMELWKTRGHEIDLVLSDVVMPHVGGPDLKRWIDAQRPMTRTIFMSGYTNSETFDEVLTDTGADFLQKPFTPDELARRVRDVLDRPSPLPN